MAGKRGPTIQRQLLLQSREAALNAIQTFNNPLATFKSETFIALMNIAWTYLLHAYFRGQGIEYRYYTQGPNRRKFHRTKGKAFRYWELERCLNEDSCSLDAPTRQNLRFLIGLRNEIEHHKSAGVDERFSGRYLACCLNYERYVCELFDEGYSLADCAAFTLQFRDLRSPANSEEVVASSLPSNVSRYVQEFDASLDDVEFESLSFSYRTIFIPKLVNHRGQADRAIEFIGADSDLAKEVDKQYWVQKAVEKPKFLAKDVIAQMHSEGFKNFGIYQHTRLWKDISAKDPSKGFGVPLGSLWYWYENWVERVRQHCSENEDKYKLVDQGNAA